MKTCDKGHVLIVFDVEDCPMCYELEFRQYMLVEREEYRTKIKNQEIALVKFTECVGALEQKIQNMEAATQAMKDGAKPEKQ